jgi:hypothetical protein
MEIRVLKEPPVSRNTDTVGPPPELNILLTCCEAPRQEVLRAAPSGNGIEH